MADSQTATRGVSDGTWRARVKPSAPGGVAPGVHRAHLFFLRYLTPVFNYASDLMLGHYVASCLCVQEFGSGRGLVGKLPQSLVC